MATITYALSKKISKGNNKSQIYFRFVGGREFTKRLHSQIYINKDRWNSVEKHIIMPRTDPVAKEEMTNLQKTIEDLKNLLIIEFEKQLQIDKTQITDEWFEKIIDKFHNPENYVEKQSIYNTTMLNYIDNYIKNDAPLKRNKKTRLKLAPNMLQQYKATHNLLVNYFTSNNKEDLLFNQIDIQFYEAFVSFLQAEPRCFYINTVGKHIRILKTILNTAPAELKVLSSHHDFYVFSEETDNIFFDEKEIKKLWDFNFSEKPNHDRVRDWFILLAWTGCRYSDLDKIIKTKKGAEFINYTQQKTKTKVIIPVHEMVRAVFEKYNYQVPEPITNQKFNEEFKEVVEIAGFNEPVEIQRNIGGVIETLRFEKHQLATSHCGRRSFCTNLYNQKIPTLYIMKASGHKTERSFLRYIKMDEQQHAERMADEWKTFYNKDKTKPNSKNEKKSTERIKELEITLSAIRASNLALNDIIIKINNDNNKLISENNALTEEIKGLKK